MNSIADAVVIGAGPYGLSAAAHLAAQGMDIRVFGDTMATWRDAMPEGMVLKSEGFASSLSDPRGELALRNYCWQRAIPYADAGLPIPLATFVSYGEAFQQQFVPMLERRLVTGVATSRDGFELTLDNEERVRARRVVVAAGIRAFEYIPPELSRLPPSLATHTAAHHRLQPFANKEVLIIGAGASAIGMAVLMHQKGAQTTVVARRPSIPWVGPPELRTLRNELRAPISGLGTGWRSWLAANAPTVFHQMPEWFRLLVVRKHLGPAPGWTVRDHAEKHVQFVLGAQLGRSWEQGGRVHLEVRLDDGSTRELSADHVVAGTGYEVDLRRLAFLAPVLPKLRMVAQTPILSRHFEASIPGLYFIGTTAANSFGPLLRFVAGVDFASRQVVAHAARASVARKSAAPAPVTHASATATPTPSRAGI